MSKIPLKIEVSIKYGLSYNNGRKKGSSPHSQAVYVHYKGAFKNLKEGLRIIWNLNF